MEWQWWLDFIPDKIYRTFAEAGLFIIAGFCLAWIVHLIVRLIQLKITSRTETDLDDRIVAVLKKSAKRLVHVSAIYLAILHLDTVIKGTWTVYADGVFFITVVLLITILLSGIINEIFQWYLESVAVKTESTLDDELIPLARRVVNIILYSIAIVTCLDHFNIDIKALIVSLGVGSLAVALAAQETLANMIAGFVIMVDRPFRVGDRINFPKSNKVGDVIKIGLRSTKILDFDNNIVTIPNADIVKNDIINFSYPNIQIRLKIDVDVCYGTDLEKAKALLVETVSSFETVLEDPKPAAYVVDFKESGVGLTVIGRVRNYRELWDTLDMARMKIYKVFNEHQIAFAFPHRVVIQKNDLPLPRV